MMGESIHNYLLLEVVSGEEVEPVVAAEMSLSEVRGPTSSLYMISQGMVAGKEDELWYDEG